MNVRQFVTSFFIVAAVVMLQSCMKNSSNPSSATTQGTGTPPNPNTVLIASFAFSPSSITVSKGTTLTWTNRDAATHSATADGAQWDTGDIATGASKSVTFNTAGTFGYHCARHPMMTATVTVQ